MDEALKKKLDDVRTKGGVEMMKASAGSGKTFSLAREYIRLLLKDWKPDAHRHILAVTFTNKATEEMKSRIVDELDTLAHFTAKSGYREYLLEQCGFRNERELQKTAEKALVAILNDYSSFSVSTIDKFFQQTLRAFAREIGQISEYKVELDRDALVDESVDVLLDSLSEDKKELLKWLAESSREKIEAGEGYHLESNLRSFASGYLTQAYEDKRREKGVDEADAFSPENLTKMTSACRAIINAYDDDFKTLFKDADTLLRRIDSYATVQSSLRKYVDEALDCIPSQYTFRTIISKVAEEGTKAVYAPQAKKLSAADVAELEELFSKIESLAGDRLCEMRTARILVKQIYVFRVASELSQAFTELLKEKNVLGIDDTNKILKDIIGNTDTPFIYEKTGSRYDHFLLDEFQDTSNIQWDCFKSLLRNSIDSANYNLIVGDIKQSIYRWRDADWKILGEKVKAEINNESQLAENPLDKNWRSAENIIKFNNGFYATLAEARGIQDIYSGVEQQTNDKIKVPGFVEMAFCKYEEMMDRVVAMVQEVHERDFKYKDIAVIVRTNGLGQKAAESLLSAGIPVITNDTLVVGKAKSVRDVVLGLSFLDDPEDKINSFEAPDFDYSVLDNCRSLAEMANALLAQLPKEQTDRDTLYILSFLDAIADYVSNNGNALHAFLEWWRDKGMDKCISSPKDSDAVTIITVHKCKGLDYPCTIIPLPYQDNLVSGKDSMWEEMRYPSDGLEPFNNALYRVNISDTGLSGTYFYDSFVREKNMGIVDQANTWYVATTRASEELHIISNVPSGSASWDSFTHIKDALYLYVTSEESGFLRAAEDTDTFEYGTRSSKFVKPADEVKRAKPSDRILKFNHEGVSGVTRGNTRISNEAEKFFLGSSTNPRQRWGTILHDILQDVLTPEDLPGAVNRARMDGIIDSSEAEIALSSLSAALVSVEDRGWFRAERQNVRSERDILFDPDAVGVVMTDKDGNRKNDGRPDRVVIKDGGRTAEIIDYKFGERAKEHSAQVSLYVELYRKMGFENVRGYLWYVDEKAIEQILA